jgi:hypothetical protein
MVKSLNGTKSHENLKHAFAGESQANRRYSVFRAGRGYRRVSGCRWPVSRYFRGGNGSCLRSSRFLERSRRSLHRRAHRFDRQELKVGC